MGGFNGRENCSRGGPVGEQDMDVRSVKSERLVHCLLTAGYRNSSWVFCGNLPLLLALQC